MAGTLTMFDIASQVHVQGKEKLSLLERILPVIDDKAVWGKTEIILDFFNSTLKKHFEQEEILIDMLRRGTTLLPAEDRYLSEVLLEHRQLLEKLARLAAIAREFDPGRREIRERFIEAAHAIIDQLIPHAQAEDEKLFPLGRTKLNEGQKAALTRAILERP